MQGPSHPERLGGSAGGNRESKDSQVGAEQGFEETFPDGRRQLGIVQETAIDKKSGKHFGVGFFQSLQRFTHGFRKIQVPGGRGFRCDSLGYSIRSTGHPPGHHSAARHSPRSTGHHSAARHSPRSPGHHAATGHSPRSPGHHAAAGHPSRSPGHHSAARHSPRSTGAGLARISRRGVAQSCGGTAGGIGLPLQIGHFGLHIHLQAVHIGHHQIVVIDLIKGQRAGWF